MPTPPTMIVTCDVFILESKHSSTPNPPILVCTPVRPHARACTRPQPEVSRKAKLSEHVILSHVALRLLVTPCHPDHGGDTGLGREPRGVERMLLRAPAVVPYRRVRHGSEQHILGTLLLWGWGDEGSRLLRRLLGGGVGAASSLKHCALQF